MSKDLAYLRAKTRTYLDESAQADWTDDEVDRDINSKYLAVYTAIVSVYDDYYSCKSTTNTVADQQEYGLPGKGRSGASYQDVQPDCRCRHHDRGM